MLIIKRSGKEAEFEPQKIIHAISAANENAVKERQLSEYQIKAIELEIEKYCARQKHAVGIEDIQDLIEQGIMEHRAYEVAQFYIRYRWTRELGRKSNTIDNEVLALIERQNEIINQENSNKNPIINSTQRDYMAGAVSKDLTNRILLPQQIVDAHNDGLLHFHDADYFAQHMHNCCLVNLEDMLQNGTVISQTKIDTPKSFLTACNISTQIVAQVASSQYGGQTITLAHLAPFVDVSRKKLIQSIKQEFEDAKITASSSQINDIAENRLTKEISSGIQLIQYQLITLMTTNGQTPFVSIFMYLDEVSDGRCRDDLALIIEETLKQRILGVKNESGTYITPAFPKLIYVLDEDNINENQKYFYLTELAAKCTAKRMVPDFISAKKMKELKNGNVYSCMGCRSFLTVFNDESGIPKFYGRFNQGVVTINLVDIACTSDGSVDDFWKIFDKRLDLCHTALRRRHERLLGTPSDVAPILWQHGALSRLKKGETIDKLLYNGYSTLSLGYAGLCECTYRMTGRAHTDPSATQFALSVMQKLNEVCMKWKEEEHIDYSVYGTPLESTTYKFAKNLQRRFGIIPNVTDKNYITNSYHIHVTEKIDAFSKLTFESQFQKLSPGGAISYVEVPDMQQNIPAVLEVMKHIYNNIMYAELNAKSDYCENCGFSGEIQIVEDKKTQKLIWECPNCKNRNQSKMNVARRTCGYIGTQFWNQGRTQEIKERVLHL